MYEISLKSSSIQSGEEDPTFIFFSLQKGSHWQRLSYLGIYRGTKFYCLTDLSLSGNLCLFLQKRQKKKIKEMIKEDKLKKWSKKKIKEKIKEVMDKELGNIQYGFNV